MLRVIVTALSLVAFCGCDPKSKGPGGSSNPPPPAVLTPPATPQAVSAAVNADGTKVTVNWNAVDAEGYYLMRFDNESTHFHEYDLLVTLPAGTTAWDDTNVLGCKSYHYDVRAFNSFGMSDFGISNTVVLPIFPPTACSAVYVSPSEGVKLGIKDAFPCVKGYALYRSVNHGGWELYRDLPPSRGEIVFYDTAANQDGVEYCYKVVMYSTGGESPPVLSNCVIPRFNDPPPPPPRHVDVTAGDGGLIVGWDDPTDVETGFLIYRKVDKGAYELSGDVAADQTTFTDDHVAACRTYTYAVTTYGDGGESAKCESAAYVMAPQPPATVAAAFSGLSRGITISFDDTSTCERGYRLYRAVNDGEFSFLTLLPATDDVHIAYADRAIQTGTTYHYAVSVLSPANQESKQSTISNSVVTAGLVPETPTDLDATCSLVDRQVRLTWTDRSDDEDGFIIERTYVVSKITRTDHFQLDPNTTSYNDPTVQSGYDYCYRVAAFNPAGQSAFSTRDCVAVDFVDILTPQDGLVTNTNRIAFTVQVQPNISRLSDTVPIVLLANNQPHAVGLSNNFIFSNLLLSPGKNEIVLSLSYKNGEIAELPITVTYDAAQEMSGRPILYSALSSGVALTDPLTLQNIGYLRLPFNTYYNLRISPDGKILYAFRSGFVTRIDQATNTIIDEKPLAFDGALALSHDGERLGLTAASSFVVYDTRTWEVVRFTNGLWSATRAAYCTFNPVNGDLFVGANGSGGYHYGPVGCFRYPNYDRAYTYNGVDDFYVTTIRVSPDGTTTVVTSASWGRGNIYAFDAVTGKHKYALTTKANYAHYVWFEPDSLTYWANDDAYYYRIETATGKILLWQGHGFSWGLLAAEPNVGFLPAADANGFNRIARFNLETNETTGVGFITGVPNEPIKFKNLVYKP